jgi:hypothetical protein
MTCIYQSPDAVNTIPLKDAINRNYEKHWNEVAHLFVPGAEINISCSMLTQFILNVYEQINKENIRNCYICNAFELCDLNQLATDDSKLIAHVYSALIDKYLDETCT